MLAVAWDRPFTDPDWWFEPKWDGVRCRVEWDGTDLRLLSRTGRQMSYPEFGPPTEAPVVLDAEIVALDEEGKPSFQLLQSRLNLGGSRTTEAARSAPIVGFVFDLLALDGEALTKRSFAERRDRLEALDLAPPWFLTTGMAGDGDAMWATIEEQGLEGMVAKRLDSPYRPDVRSPDWRKIVRYRSVRAVVGGFTAGEGGRADTFGSLVLGQWDGDALRWVGQVGTGFDDAALAAIRTALDEMATEDDPFHPDLEMPAATFVEPHLVAHVRIKEWTFEGRLRHPSFKGFGPEDAAAITWDDEGPGSPYPSPT
jgi:bifunctional non-homologous end joining protein LigD